MKIKKHYKTRLDFNILRLPVRPQLPKIRFHAMKNEFFDTAKKQRFDSTTKGPRFARNRKIEFPISFGNLNINSSIWLLESTGFERFTLISSTNIENYNFAILFFSACSKDTRFHQNYEVQQTPQNLSKIQNVDAFATSKTSKWLISHGFCRLFRILAFVGKRLCDSLANFVLLCWIITWNIRFSP